MLSIAETTSSIMAALFWICETTPANSFKALSHDSMKEGMRCEFQFKGVNPVFKTRCSVASWRTKSSDSTRERDATKASYFESFKPRFCRYEWYLSSCSVTFRAASGTAKPIRSRYFDSRMIKESSGAKLTRYGGEGILNLAASPFFATKAEECVACDLAVSLSVVDAGASSASASSAATACATAHKMGCFSFSVATCWTCASQSL
mmetsp:Transcript_8625/g.29630  ORF Transcript_8625/g.29630 Transcript_8625/m.29630 type:complete len:206 (+) Transcript_8625:518-1135(+)